MAAVRRAEPMVEFKTGARRSEEKLRYDLIPREALERLALRYTGSRDENGEPTGGALKYGDFNWEKGLPLTDTLNHVYDHLERFKSHLAFMRKISDTDSPDDPFARYWAGVVAGSIDDDLAAAAWGIFALITFLSRVQSSE